MTNDLDGAYFGTKDPRTSTTDPPVCQADPFQCLRQSFDLSRARPLAAQAAKSPFWTLVASEISKWNRA